MKDYVALLYPNLFSTCALYVTVTKDDSRDQITAQSSWRDLVQKRRSKLHASLHTPDQGWLAKVKRRVKCS